MTMFWIISPLWSTLPHIRLHLNTAVKMFKTPQNLNLIREFVMLWIHPDKAAITDCSRRRHAVILLAEIPKSKFV